MCWLFLHWIIWVGIEDHSINKLFFKLFQVCLETLQIYQAELLCTLEPSVLYTFAFSCTEQITHLCPFWTESEHGASWGLQVSIKSHHFYPYGVTIMQGGPGTVGTFAATEVWAQWQTLLGMAKKISEASCRYRWLGLFSLQCHVGNFISMTACLYVKWKIFLAI